jgi:hypothetical protein
MHLCGMATRPDTLCLGPGDLRERLAGAAGVVWLAELMRHRSLVLVGFRPADPDLDWLMSFLAAVAAAPNATRLPPSYLLLDVSGEADAETEAHLVELRSGMIVLPFRGGTAEALERLAQLSGQVGTDAGLGPSDADIDVAMDTPPQTTRARLRGEFIKRAKERKRDYTVDWVHLKLNDQAQRTVLCKDPFKSRDERVEKLISSL